MTAIFAFFATAFKYALGNWQKLLAIVGGVLILCALSYCQGRSDGRAAVQLQLEKANNEYLREKGRADALAAERRLTDTVAINNRERELIDAIRATPDSAPDAARVSLGCARLRAASPRGASLPAVCGPQGGTQARPAG